MEIPPELTSRILFERKFDPENMDRYTLADHVL